MKSIHDHLDKLRREHSEQLLTIDEKVNPADFEATAILKHLELAGKYPVVYFTQPQNLKGEISKFPLLMNVFAKRELCALALGLTPQESKLAMSLEYARRESGKLATTVVPASQAPVKEMVKIGDEADLREFPIVRHHEMDLAPYIDMGVVMRDPDSGAYNNAIIRTMYKEPRRLGLYMARRHNWEIVRKNEALGRNTPVVLILSHRPDYYLGAMNSAPFGIDDYEVISSVMQESLRLTTSETWGDGFLVPADAEILVEGEVLAGVREVEAPFGECHEYSGPQRLAWVIEVKAITHRKNAIFQSIFVGHAENWIMGAITKEATIYHRIQAFMPNVKGVHFPNSGCGRYNCVISIAQTSPGQAKQAALIALGTADFFKNVVVVDDDIDPYDEREVIWAISTRIQADEDIDILRNVSYAALDPSTRVEGVSAKMIIDATKPFGKPFDERLRVPCDAMERVAGILKRKSLI